MEQRQFGSSEAIPAELVPVLGICRAIYADKHLAIPMGIVHKDRVSWLGMADKQMSEMADHVVFQYGMSLYAYDVDLTQGSSIGDLPRNYEECRDFFCRCEISQRTGVPFNGSPPHGFEIFMDGFWSRMTQREENRKRG